MDNLVKLLRKYNAVIIGDDGIRDAYKGFLKSNGMRHRKPTKRQKACAATLGVLSGETTTGTNTTTEDLNLSCREKK